MLFELIFNFLWKLFMVAIGLGVLCMVLGFAWIGLMKLF
jgi:hypothetical protein